MKKISFGILLFCLILLFFSSDAFAKLFGERACYRSGAYWYCARYDNTSFPTTCAGRVPAPHVNAEVFKGSSSKLNQPAIRNWHLGWQNTNGKYCLIAYESQSGKCQKFCYDKKVGKGSDILPSLGFPENMIQQSDVSKVFQKIRIQPGESPESATVWIYGVAVAIFAVSAHTLARIVACFIAKVCT